MLLRRNQISLALGLRDRFELEHAILQFRCNLAHQVDQFGVLLIVEHFLVELLILLHFIVLHALGLGVTRNSCYSFTNKLLNADRYVLINEVLHRLDLIQMCIKVVIASIEL